jgi:hypothetical protein
MTGESVVLKNKAWGPGLWDSEPDQETWTDPLTGLECAAARNQMGAWCGYVQVPGNNLLHPLAVGCGWARGDCRCQELDVHGGVTLHNDERAKAIGLEGTLVGFDCGHAYDLIPGAKIAHLDCADVYRTLEYVKSEVARLAIQVKEMK